MTPVLTAAERSRLAKLLGMFGSVHPGERDAAALAADRLVRQRGLTWLQVIDPPAIEKPLSPPGRWRETVSDCLAQRGSLRVWEREFLGSLAGFPRISRKQQDLLDEIAQRILAKEREHA